MDLARGLNTRIADAERIKTLYGTVLGGGSDERDMITVPPLEEHEREQAQLVSRATLVSIIKPRVEEILEMVRDRLAACPIASDRRGHVVLTGGASQLNGLPELAARLIGRPARLGRPLGIAGAPDAAKGPAFAVAAGLLLFPPRGGPRTFLCWGRGGECIQEGGGVLLRLGRGAGGVCVW